MAASLVVFVLIEAVDAAVNVILLESGCTMLRVFVSRLACGVGCKVCVFSDRRVYNKMQRVLSLCER